MDEKHTKADDKRKERKKFVQFAPELNNPSPPGAYGWGFDSHGYRIVVYLPKQCDTEITKSLDQKISKETAHPLRDDTDDDNPHANEISKIEAKHVRREKKRTESKPQIPKRGEEHGPAHIHVIHKKSGMESKFELIKHFKKDEDGNVMNTVEILENGTPPLTAGMVKEVFPILQEYVSDFVQEWQEAYAHTKLGSYVTRISEKYPNYRERIVFNGSDNPKDVWVELENTKNNERTVMRLDDYIQLHPRHSKHH